MAALVGAAERAAEEHAWFFVQPSDVALAAALALVESLPEEASYEAWRPYVATLPPAEARGMLPLLWDEGGKEMDEAHAVTQVGAAVRRLRREADGAALLAVEVLRAAGIGAGEARLAFLGALSMVLSRAFGVDVDDLEGMTAEEAAGVRTGSNLIPVVDMCNGAMEGDSNVEVVISPVEDMREGPPAMCMVLLAERDLDEGEELLLSYGSTSTNQFVAKYGCAPAGCAFGAYHALDSCVMWPPEGALPPDAPEGGPDEAELREAIEAACHGASMGQLRRPTAKGGYSETDVEYGRLISPFTLMADDVEEACAAAEAAREGAAGAAAAFLVEALRPLRRVARCLAIARGAESEGAAEKEAAAAVVAREFADDALCCLPDDAMEGEEAASFALAGVRHACAAERALLLRWRNAI